MACFDDLISIEQTCDPVTPTSGYYLNQIGINKSEIEQIITSDYTNVDDFVADKVSFAITNVTNKIYTHLRPKYKADSILVSARVGFPATDKELITQSGYVGLHVTVHNPNSYIDFVISDISLFVDSTTTVPVLIYDLDQGKLLQTINVATTAGEISISYEKAVISAPRKKLNLWIGYDGTAINSYKTNTTSACGTCTGYTFNHRYVRASGASIESPFTNTNLTSINTTSGLMFNYSVNCNHTDWLCTQRQLLSLPILYATGIEICNHALLSAPNQRTMAITTVNGEVMEKKLMHYTQQYETIMSELLRGMQIPNDTLCFHCDKKIQSVTVLP